MSKLKSVIKVSEPLTKARYTVNCNGKELLIIQLSCYFWVTKQYMKTPDCMYLSCIKLLQRKYKSIIFNVLLAKIDFLMN